MKLIRNNAIMQTRCRSPSMANKPQTLQLLVRTCIQECSGLMKGMLSCTLKQPPQLLQPVSGTAAVKGAAHAEWCKRLGKTTNTAASCFGSTRQCRFYGRQPLCQATPCLVVGLHQAAAHARAQVFAELARHLCLHDALKTLNPAAPNGTVAAAAQLEDLHAAAAALGHVQGKP